MVDGPFAHQTNEKFPNFADIENTTMFEVSALSFQHISVALEHPFEESMATVEFTMTDTSEIECKIYSINVNYEAIASKLSKILEKCMSIPITLRALIKCWEQEKNMQRMDNGNFNMPSGGQNDSSGRNEDFRDMKGGGKGGDRNGMNGNANGAGGGGGGGGFSEHTMFSGGGSDSSALIHEPPYSDSEMSKRQRTEDFYRNPKSEISSSDMLEHQSSDSSDNSLGTTSAMSEAGVATPSSNASFATESDPISIDNANTDSQKAADDDASNEMRDAGDSEKRKQKKAMTTAAKESSNEEAKGNLPQSVSITPITSSSGFNSVLTGLERRLDIEIIPISSTPPMNIKSSITITPINAAKGGGGEKSNSSGSKRSDDRAKAEKKKKRKRDDSPMGPPEKMAPFKQDPLSRPVSVTIKTTDGKFLTFFPLSKSQIFVASVF